MSPTLDELLCNRYPLIFRDRHEATRPTLMTEGFSCDDAWFPVIDGLCAALQFETDYNGMPQVIARQVKEKCGGLRFHHSGGDKRASVMIAVAIAISERLPAEPGPLAASSTRGTPQGAG